MNSKFYSYVKIFIVILEEEKIRQAQKDIPHPEARRKNDFRQKHLNNTLQHVNEYVTQLVDLVDEAGSLHYKKKMRVKPPVKIPTPYGGRLIWTLPGKTKIVAHLKDKSKIRNKKRWSQCMYMYYLLGFKLVDNPKLNDAQKEVIKSYSFLIRCYHFICIKLW